MTRSHVALAAALLLALACSATPPTAPDAEPIASPPPPTATTTGTTRTGTFSGLAGHRASGGVRLIVNDTIATIEFAADFVVDGVPGPFVYVNTGTNANLGLPLRVGPLARNSGTQSYSFRLPSGVTYSHVLVWCDPFNVGVGSAALAP